MRVCLSLIPAAQVAAAALVAAPFLSGSHETSSVNHPVLVKGLWKNLDKFSHSPTVGLS